MTDHRKIDSAFAHQADDFWRQVEQDRRSAVIAWLLIAAVMVGCTAGGWIAARATSETCEAVDV